MSAKVFDCLAPSFTNLVFDVLFSVAFSLISFKVHSHVDSLVLALDCCFKCLGALCLHDFALTFESSHLNVLALKGGELLSEEAFHVNEVSLGLLHGTADLLAGLG